MSLENFTLFTPTQKAGPGLKHYISAGTVALTIAASFAFGPDILRKSPLCRTFNDHKHALNTPEMDIGTERLIFKSVGLCATPYEKHALDNWGQIPVKKETAPIAPSEYLTTQFSRPHQDYQDIQPQDLAGVRLNDFQMYWPDNHLPASTMFAEDASDTPSALSENTAQPFEEVFTQSPAEAPPEAG